MNDFQNLTISNSFMFAAVMEDTENCKGLLEIVLEFPVARIELSTEKSIIHHPQYHGVRLDVYAKGDDNTRYNVEMQVLYNSNLPKRSFNYAQHNALKPNGFIANLSGEIKYSLRSCLISFG